VILLFSNDRGYTFIEIIAVLIIMGLLATIAVVKYDGLHRGARDTAIKLSISELNSRERLVWNQLRMTDLSDEDFDSALFTHMISNDIYDIGNSTSWKSGPSQSGGTLTTNAGSASLTREPASRASPGQWN
jgi:prepilin-type N-terminal cleavage/methylation domain-containing protein